MGDNRGKRQINCHERKDWRTRNLLRIRITKNISRKIANQWQKIEISLESDEISASQVYAVKNQLSNAIDKMLHEEIERIRR